MKKALLAIGVIAMMGLMSCNKPQTCKCTATTNLLGIETTIDLGVHETEEGQKCKDLESSSNFGSYAQGSITCKKI